MNKAKHKNDGKPSTRRKDTKDLEEVLSNINAYGVRMPLDDLTSCFSGLSRFDDKNEKQVQAACKICCAVVESGFFEKFLNWIPNLKVEAGVFILYHVLEKFQNLVVEFDDEIWRFISKSWEDKDLRTSDRLMRLTLFMMDSKETPNKNKAMEEIFTTKVISKNLQGIISLLEKQPSLIEKLLAVMDVELNSNVRQHQIKRLTEMSKICELSGMAREEVNERMKRFGEVLCASDITFCVQQYLDFVSKVTVARGLDQEIHVKNIIRNKALFLKREALSKVITLFGELSDDMWILVPGTAEFFLIEGFKLSREFYGIQSIEDIVRLIKKLLKPVSLGVFEENYKMVIGLISEAFEKLKTPGELAWNEARETVVILGLLLSSLEVLVENKNSISVIHGTKPPLFEFFAKQLPLTEPWLAENHPEIFHMLISQLIGSLKANKFHVDCSRWLQTGQTNGYFHGTSPRAEYAEIQVVLLSKLLTGKGWKQTRVLLVSWIKGLIEMFPIRSLHFLWENDQWMRLRSSLLKAFTTFEEKLVQEIKDLLDRYDLRLKSNDADFFNNSKQILYGSVKTWSGSEMGAMLRNCLTSNNRPPQQQKMIRSTSFGKDEFEIVMNFLIKGILPTRSRPHNEENKENEERFDDPVDDILNRTLGMKPLDGSKVEIGTMKFMEKWRHVLGQAANFCVVTKLKTHLGDTLNTLSTFSNELERLAKEALKTGPEQSVEVQSDETKLRDAKTGPQASEWLRVRLLLEFIEQLEKLMRNIIDGESGFQLCEYSQDSRTFFVNNAKSFLIWLLKRTYTKAMIVSFSNGYYALSVRFGACVLDEMSERLESQNSQKPEDLQRAQFVAVWMGRALASLGSRQAIDGLALWLQKLLKIPEPPLIYGALSNFAAGRYDIAFATLQEIIHTDTMSTEVEKTVARITNYEVLFRLRFVAGLRQPVLESTPQPFDEELKSVTDLINFQRSSDVRKPTRKGWMITEQLIETESIFTQTLKRPDVLTIKTNLARLGTYVYCAENGPNILCGRIASTHQIATALYEQMKNYKETLDSNVNPKSKVANLMSTSPIVEKQSSLPGNVGERLTTLLQLTSNEWKFNRQYSASSIYNVFRLSRKTGNQQLCEQFKNIPLPMMNMSDPKEKTLFLMKMGRQIMKYSDNFHEKDAIRSELIIMALQYQNAGDYDFATEIAKTYMTVARDEELENIIHRPNVLAELPELCPNDGMIDRLREVLYLKAIDVCPVLPKTRLVYGQYLLDQATSLLIERFERADLSRPTRIFVEEHNYLKDVKTTKELDRLLVGLSGDERNKVATEWSAVSACRRNYELIALGQLFQYVNSPWAHGKTEKKWSLLQASLKIIDLMCQHGDDAVRIISPMVSLARVSVWKEVIPQLIARLAHPAPLVRKLIIQLLKHIATVSPNSLVFQIVGGGIASSTSTDGPESKEDKNVMREGYRQLESHLAENSPQLVADVRLFVKELERINMLNEEKWWLVLKTLERETEKRIKQVKHQSIPSDLLAHLTEEEKCRIAEKKTHVFIEEVLGFLVPLFNKTCRQELLESENERQFEETYGRKMTELMEKRPESVRETHLLIKSMINMFGEENAKRVKKSKEKKENSNIFEMKSLSDDLSAMQTTFIPMPGCDDSDPSSQPVTIQKVGKSVWVIPSKTMPKKLSFIGSDGHERPFVLKGREDLHLDERVMQFYRVCNAALSSGKAKREHPSYEAFTYSVVPVGPCSGLIQWVQGSALMTVYKKYHNREAERKGERPKRVIETYQNVRDDVLKKMNVGKNTDRREYPDAALLEALKTLMSQTPKNLLSRELSILSVNSSTWWEATSRFARSSAVMSMLGYILGLGDRHLDNIMVNLNTGMVVHIDYNVCFDKGKKLHVPETVPFRLTRNIVHALGPTGTKGIFEESCIHVLDRLCDVEADLRAILSVFIYDPLADWTWQTDLANSSVQLAMNIAVFGSKWKRENLLKTAAETFEVTMEELLIRIQMTCTQLGSSLNSLATSLEYNGVINLEQVTELDKRIRLLMNGVIPLIRTLSLNDERFSSFYRLYNAEYSEPLKKCLSELQVIAPHRRLVTEFRKCAEAVEKVGIQLALLNTNEKQQYVPPPPGLENVWLERRDQEGNMYARSLIDTVMERLDKEKMRNRSVKTRVSELIAEATDVNRLSRMYEGWIPWV